MNARVTVVMGFWLALGLVVEARAQDSNPVLATGGYGAPTMSGIPSYGVSTFYPPNSGGMPLHYSGFGMPTLGNPANPVSYYDGNGIMGYGRGFGYGSEMVNPPAAGGFGLPDVIGQARRPAFNDGGGAVPFLYGRPQRPVPSTHARALRPKVSPLLPALRYQVARPASSP